MLPPSPIQEKELASPEAAGRVYGKAKVELAFTKSPGLGDISPGGEKANLPERRRVKGLNNDRRNCKNSLSQNKGHVTLISPLRVDHADTDSDHLACTF